MMSSASLVICDKKKKNLTNCDKKRKRLTICEKKRKNKTAKIVDDGGVFHSRLPDLPQELILENILTRLPARDLAKWSCASKHWYESILQDSKFASSHFEHNKSKLNLAFNLLNVEILGERKGYYLSVDEEKTDNEFRLLMNTSSPDTDELVGCCNGLVCTKQVGNPNPTGDGGHFYILNPTRWEMLTLNYSVPTSCTHLCHGFGFDSLSQQYKVVFIYTTTSEITRDQEFVCMVLTLGVGGTNTNYAWRKTVTSTAQITPTSPFPGRIVTTSSKITRRSATLWEGDLLWRITNCMSDDDNKIDMLLSFDIHEEKIRFISLPTGCSLTRTTATTQNDEFQCLLIDHHLLEFKGYLCVARSEKIMTRRNRHHRHHRHCGHPRIRSRSGFCCCGFKVHMYVLKDKVNQLWAKVRTFDIQIKDQAGLLPAPFCCYFDTTSTTALPTRMLSFSDQLFLYWADGEHLLLYNLQMKHLKVLKCSGRRMHPIDGDIFGTKLRNGINPGQIIDDDDNTKFLYMDYQLHAQAENILSLKSFIPEGETKHFYSHSDFERRMENGEIKEPAGLLSTPRELVRCRAFY